MLRTLPGIFLLLLVACNKSVTTAGSAEGYGGGDNDIAAVENARLAAVATLKGIRDGEMSDPICQIPICMGTSCAAVRSMGEEQRQFLVHELTDPAYVEKLLTVLDDPKAFKVSDTPILINGKEMDAATELGGGKVVLNRKRLNNVLKIEIISLLVHETMHAVAFPYDGNDGLLSDEEAISEAGAVLFTSGRQLADLTGACVALHEERELILESVSSIGNTPSLGAGQTPSGGLPSNLVLAPTATPLPASPATPTPNPSLPPVIQDVPAAPAPTPTPLPSVPATPEGLATLPSPPPLPTNLPPLPSGLPFPPPIRVPGR